ncbi:MAG: hypothetical protein ABI665_04305 [Vicinamibacterales bacterium]
MFNGIWRGLLPLILAASVLAAGYAAYAFASDTASPPADPQRQMSHPRKDL